MAKWFARGKETGTMTSPNLPDDSDKASSQSESAIKDNWQRITLKKRFWQASNRKTI